MCIGFQGDPAANARAMGIYKTLQTLTHTDYTTAQQLQGHHRYQAIDAVSTAYRETMELARENHTYTPQEIRDHYQAQKALADGWPTDADIETFQTATEPATANIR